MQRPRRRAAGNVVQVGVSEGSGAGRACKTANPAPTELVFQHGRDLATRQLADEIIAGQTTEIKSMQRRLCLLLGGHLRGAAVRRRAAALGRRVLGSVCR